MKHSKPVRLETAPTGHGGNAVRLETAPTGHGGNAVQLETAPTGHGGNAVRLGNRTYQGRKCLFILAHVKRKCKTRIEIVGAGSPRPQSVRVGEPNPYEDPVAVARFLNMNLYF